MVSCEALQRIKQNLLNFSKGPFCIDLITSPYCNLNCIYCRGGNFFSFEFKDAEQIKLKYISKLLKSAKKMDVKEISITSLVGEPMVYKNILKLLKLIKKHSFVGSLLTNGSMLNEKFAKYLLKINWNTVTISIDSVDKDILYSLRPPTSKSDYFDGLVNFLKYTKEYNSKLKIRTNVVITKKNYKEINDFFRFAEENNIKEICMLQLLKLSENPFNYESLKLNNKELEEFQELLKKIKSPIYSNIQDWLNSREIKKDNKGKFCYYFFYKLLINCNGDVLKCNGDSKKLQGLNIKHSSLEEIWFDRIKKIKDSFYNNPPCFEDCCTPIKTLNLEIYNELKAHEKEEITL